MLRTLFILSISLLLMNCSNFNGQERMTREFTDEEYEKDYDLKAKGLETILGKSHHLVGHAFIPFDAGGAVDMFYYPNGKTKGTGFATMELIQPDGTVPIPNRNGIYELVAFAKHDYANDTSQANPFNQNEKGCVDFLLQLDSIPARQI